jgi:hypothetical protein
VSSRLLHLCPLPQQVVIDAGQLNAGFLDAGGLSAAACGDSLDGGVEVEEQGSLPIVADHALDPEEAGDARASRHWLHAVQTSGRIEDHISGRQLDDVGAVAVFDDQLTTLVVLRLGEEQGGGEVRAYPLAGASILSDGRVDVRAEGLAASVAVEHGREDAERQRDRHEARTAREALQHHLADGLVRGTAFGDLRVALHLLSLVSRGDATIDPLGGEELLPGIGDLFLGEELGDCEQHSFSLSV